MSCHFDLQFEPSIQGIEKNSSVWEHKLRCKRFLQNSTFERLAAEPQTDGSKGKQMGLKAKLLAGFQGAELVRLSQFWNHVAVYQ